MKNPKRQKAQANITKTGNFSQSESNSSGAQPRPQIARPKWEWHDYIEVKREWLSPMQLCPGDAIGLDVQAKPKPGDFVVLDFGEHPYIVHLRKITRTHYHGWTFRLKPDCSFRIKHVRSIHVINMMSFQLR